MTSEISFLPWMRLGLAAHISTQAIDGLTDELQVDASVRVTLRATRPDGAADDTLLTPATLPWWARRRSWACARPRS